MKSRLTSKEHLMAHILIQKAIKESTTWDKALYKIRAVYESFK